MPTIAVVDMAGKEIEKIELNEAVFGIEPNVAVMHDVVKNILANRRQGTQSALTRAEVSGGGKKPPCSPVDSRRYRFCPEAPLLSLYTEQEGPPPGYAERTLQQGC